MEDVKNLKVRAWSYGGQEADCYQLIRKTDNKMTIQADDYIELVNLSVTINIKLQVN